MITLFCGADNGSVSFCLGLLTKSYLMPKNHLPSPRKNIVYKVKNEDFKGGFFASLKVE